MEKLIDLISGQVSAAFEAAGYDPALGRVTVSARPDLCEYQCNGAMPAAKQYHKAPIAIAEDVAATTEYGVTIHAAVSRGKLCACQFHPEKSGDVGMQILTNFANL